ncbi:hypothetical protein [Acetobacterium wieringae]|uniref:hypothetical protein n=1 Tax=Acetobacterium wieringae TaxID=52694 RepID=UPI002B1F3F36|nr:hypothetical protein [Acetobacterium wieringae]MEA4805088.1 hypothetical protein [Acetobacterium wieringae]
MADYVKDVSNVGLLLDTLKEITSFEIHVGIQADEDSKILMIAHVNEFGWQIEVTDKMRGYLGATGLHLKKDTKHINIPERSYIRGGYDANKAKIERIVEGLLEKVVALEISVSQFQNQVGQLCVGLIQEFMTDLSSPEKHPYTVDKNGGKTNPLIDTGELREKITYKVVKK